MLLDVVDDGPGEEVAYGEPAAEEEADLGRRHVVLDELVYEVDVVPPPCEAVDCLVEVGARPLDDERAVPPKNVVKLLRGMHMRSRVRERARLDLGGGAHDAVMRSAETDARDRGMVRTSASDQTPGWLIVAMRSEPARSMTRTLRFSPSCVYTPPSFVFIS